MVELVKLDAGMKRADLKTLFRSSLQSKANQVVVDARELKYVAWRTIRSLTKLWFKHRKDVADRNIRVVVANPIWAAALKLFSCSDKNLDVELDASSISSTTSSIEPSDDTSSSDD